MPGKQTLLSLLAAAVIMTGCAGGQPYNDVAGTIPAVEESKGRLNITGIAWTENRYGWASASRLRSMVRHFHPDVKVVHANPDLESDFKPLV